jgi:hypothetical protein
MADRTIVGPFGPLTIADLPPPGCTRWVVRRKVEVIIGIRGGLIDLDEARRRYRLTIDELVEWGAAFDRYGLRGLKASAIGERRRRSWEDGHDDGQPDP